ncbi:MAG TPA: response regulator transcription factor [Terracidiphilus sp.]|nr:response regulator transcription factor [Terracidiphilus sp.]
MKQDKPIRVLCADDHPLIRDGISFALAGETGIEIVACSANGSEAIDAFKQYMPDVTLMDLQMPEVNGLQALEAIRRIDPRAKCIVLTTYGGDAQAARALKAGAMGYLLKTMIRKQLVEAIRTVSSGRKYIPYEIATMVAERLDAEDLSSRELDVLRSIAAGNSNKMIAARLGISENTVKGHVKEIVAKLQATDRANAVFLAMRRGLLNRF